MMMNPNDVCILLISAKSQQIIFADPLLPQETFKFGRRISDIFYTTCSDADKTIIHSEYGKIVVSPILTDEFPLYVGIVFPPNSQYHTMEEIIEDNKRLIRENEELKIIFDSSHDGLLVVDKTGRIIRMNENCPRIMGISRDKMLNEKMQKLIQTGVVLNSGTLQVLKYRKKITFQQIFQSGKRSIVTGSPVLDEYGNICSIVVNLRDMAEVHQLLEESGQYKSELEPCSEIVNTISRQKPSIDANLTFVSEPMKHLVKSIEKYAKVDASILITGESGVGKEVVADLIHTYSDRKKAPFLKINCGAIPEGLLESELFGYEKGAFSGANKDGKAGFFELADQGTVLLDEIGELPLALQVKILRFVQEREFYRVGGNQLIKVNTRIIAATNRDLEAMVRNKEFRSDLFYRLHVLNLYIPALQERSEDIIPLTQYFLKKYNEKYHTNKTLSPEIYHIFSQYSWPGNVRELENLLEQLIVITDTKRITIEHIPERIRNFLQDANQNKECSPEMTYREAKEKFERQYFQWAIEKYGSTRKVAEKVKLDHSTIVKKARQYGISLLRWQ